MKEGRTSCGLVSEMREFFLSEHIPFAQKESSCGTLFLARRTAMSGIALTVPVLAVPVVSRTVRESESAASEVNRIAEENPGLIVVAEDRWRKTEDTVKKRLLAHLGVFVRIFARDCEVRKIQKTEADSFLSLYHSYGKASYRDCYGLFLKRERPSCGITSGTMVAVGCFSNARRWHKEGTVICSYEWVRYASMPDLRISGGMGKILSRFIADRQPDDVMSYADLEWSCGDVYRSLGFTEDGRKAPVSFAVDPVSWDRIPVSRMKEDGRDFLYFTNSGSVKFRYRRKDL